MNLKFFRNDQTFVSGMTLKDSNNFENNNMALHTSENSKQIIKNRKNLAELIGTTLDRFVCANQTHSANFYQVKEADIGRGATQLETAIPNTDALYTFEPNIVLTCFTADCVPVIFYHEKKQLIGIIHSGWQGTVKEISLKLLHHLIDVEKCDADEFTVQIGAAISQEKFEVDKDVYVKYRALGYADDYIYFNEKTKKYHIDNQQTVMKQCELAGIPREKMKLDLTCTFKSEAGFSYRQDKSPSRHLSFVMRKE